MHKSLILFFLLLLYHIKTVAQVEVSASPTFRYFVDSIRRHPKPVVLKIYTERCSYCAIQQKQISKDAALQKLLTEEYYFLQLNAETKDTIIFNGTSYQFIRNGSSDGIHQLATLGNNAKEEIAYPSWVFLNEHLAVLYRYNGIIKAGQLKKILAIILKQQ